MKPRRDRGVEGARGAENTTFPHARVKRRREALHPLHPSHPTPRRPLRPVGGWLLLADETERRRRGEQLELKQGEP